MRIRCFCAVLSWLLLSPGFGTGAPASPFSPTKLKQIDNAIEQAIAAGRIPGAILHLEARGHVLRKVYGQRSLEPTREAMTEDTIFDLASLTKVLATTPAILRLAERGELSLDQTVTSLLPSFQGNGKEDITVRHLLTHTSGLLSGVPREERPTGHDAILAWIYQCSPKTKPDLDVVYSDLNFIVLGEIVRQKSGQSLQDFVDQEIWAPLRMWQTTFRPDSTLLPRIAPTEKVDGNVLRGIVHDPTSRAMGGISGHAGAFGTVDDIVRFARMMLQGGELDGVRLFTPATLKLLTTPQTAAGVQERRALGWDIDSNLAHSPRGKTFRVGSSYGHTGYTGPSLWIDPTRDTFLLLLTNRVHPQVGDIRQLRYEIATLAATALKPTSRKAPQGESETANGVDVLARDDFLPLEGKKIGLITNHTGLSRSGQTTIDILHEAPGVHLKALFGPEHGIRGKLDQAEIPDGKDDATGLPVHSLYGASRKPASEHLAGLDALVFDIQDIGCRFYTYISTMGLAMEAAAENGLEFIVLDRVNPIGGLIVDGPSYVSRQTFTAHHNISIQHGMTVGELARLFRAEKNLDLDLTVIPVAHWNRKSRFDETGLTWINPSPNMRSLEAALLYPGIGLLEFMNLSVGRGTDTPFEHIGAPYLNADALTEHLRQQKFPGIQFEPTSYTPDASVFSGERCQGVRFQITHRDQIRPIDTALTIAKYLMEHHSDICKPDKFGTLLNHPSLSLIQGQASNRQIRQDWNDSFTGFQQRRKRYLLYP